MSNDVLRLRNMQFFAYHGLYPEENTLGQRFEVDVEILTDLSPAGTSDQVESSVDYPEVYELVKAAVTEHSFKLLEAVAEKIAGLIGGRFSPIELIVRVRKPDPPVNAQFDGVEVEIHRTYG